MGRQGRHGGRPQGRHRGLALLAVAFITIAPLSAFADANAVPAGPSDTTPAPPAAPPALDHDTPPPSAYDRQRELEGTMPEATETLTGQLFKTVLALGAVVGLIYLLFRFGPAKWLLAAQTGRTGKLVRVVERVALNQKSSLVVVEIGGERLLIGDGDGGPRLLTRVDRAAATSGRDEVSDAIADAAQSRPAKPFRSLIDIIRPKPPEDDNAPK